MKEKREMIFKQLGLAAKLEEQETEGEDEEDFGEETTENL